MWLVNWLQCCKPCDDAVIIRIWHLDLGDRSLVLLTVLLTVILLLGGNELKVDDFVK